MRGGSLTGGRYFFWSLQRAFVSAGVSGTAELEIARKAEGSDRFHDALASRQIRADQFFTSNRRTEDQLPGLPDASLASTRHHIRNVGSVLVLNCEVATVWFTIKGKGNELLSSI